MLTQAQYDVEFSKMLAKGFQVGDVALLEPKCALTFPSTIHGKSGRPCVYVQPDALVDLERGPRWIINAFHWRGALVCFLDEPEAHVKGVLCVKRSEKSAMVIPLEDDGIAGYRHKMELLAACPELMTNPAWAEYVAEAEDGEGFAYWLRFPKPEDVKGDFGLYVMTLNEEAEEGGPVF